MLNTLVDLRTEQWKVSDAFRRKAWSMSPCEAQEWWDFLKGLGVHTDQTPGGWDRAGFLRLADPVGVSHDSPASTRFGLLYVPEELAMKILVLGHLP